jgi:multidrug efflux pump subunit AcrB
MNALGFALRHPLTILVAVTAIALGSVFSVNRMHTDVFPDLNQPVIYVAQPYGGMDPAQMEGLITNYYEYAFLFMNGIDHVESKNVQNIAMVKLYFHPGTNMAQAVAEAAIYANRAKAFFPPGTVTPFIMSLDASMVPVAYVTLSSDTRSIDELADLMLFRIRPKLASLPGTTAPQPFGGSLRSIVVNLDPERLRAYNLSPEKVAKALDKGNTITPSGNARVRDLMPIVSVNSIVVNPQDLGNIPIKPERSVYLRDLGEIKDTTDIPTGWALVNGRRAVYMPILKTADASTLTVATQLKNNMEDMRGVLPKDCKLELEFDQSPYVTGAVGGVVQESAIGAVLTGLMVLLFLRDWRSVIVVVLTIPLSLMGALIGLYITGQSINLMTLGGMSLAVGILVDEGTVVIENIHTQMGKKPALSRAVLVGTAETMVPILLAMLCILAVFIPSFLMEGAARSLFVPLAISVGFAMITAFFLSVTFVPVLSIWILKPHSRSGAETQSPRTFSFAGFRQRYVEWVRGVLGRRWLVLGVYVAAVVGVLGLFGLQVGQEISPQVDSGQFQIRLKAPTGSRLEVTEELTRQALEEVKNVLGPDSIKISVAHIGQTAPTFTANAVFLWTSGPDQAVIRVALNEAKHFRTEEVKERLRKELPTRLRPWLAGRLRSYGVPGDEAAKRVRQVSVSFEPADVINQVMSLGSPTPVEVVISGPNQEDNRAYAEKVADQMRKIPTLRDLQFGQAFAYPRIKVDIDRERAGQAGLTVAEAANAMIAATSSSRYIVPVYWADPKTGIGYQVQLQVPPAQMNSNAEVGMIPVKENEGQAATLLRDVARVNDSTMPQEYDRINQRRIVSITANVVGEDLGRAVRHIEDAITAAGEPPRGVKVGNDLGHIRGQVPAMRQMFGGLATGLVIAVIVVFLLLTAYFQSIKLALVSVAPVPAVVAGVAFALYLTGTTLNIQSFMGAIMAVGVAVANAILLVTFAEKARREGMGAAEGARFGAEDRMRAILMTSCAMIVGMIPPALGLGQGGEQSAPMGRAVIGGLLAATVATLLILPAVFTVVMGSGGVRSPSLHPDDADGAYYAPETPEGVALAHGHERWPALEEEPEPAAPDLSITSEPPTFTRTPSAAEGTGVRPDTDPQPPADDEEGESP